MTNRLPAPYADPQRHRLMLNNGLNRFPKRRENYQRYEMNQRGYEVDYFPVMMDMPGTEFILE